MIRFFTIVITLIVTNPLVAQKKKSNDSPSHPPKVDTIAFHLYTDSLKKGVHNYISIDGRLPGGSWYPLSSEEIEFVSDEGSFEGNNLILPLNFPKEKVTITATYKRNPKLRQQVTIYIKTVEDGPLKTKEQIMEEIRQGGKKKRGRNGLSQ